MIFICILCLFSVGHSSCWMNCKHQVDTHYTVLFREKGQEKKSLYTDAIISDILWMQNPERQTLASIDPSVKWVTSSILVTVCGRK